MPISTAVFTQQSLCFFLVEKVVPLSDFSCTIFCHYSSSIIVKNLSLLQLWFKQIKTLGNTLYVCVLFLLHCSHTTSWLIVQHWARVTPHTTPPLAYGWRVITTWSWVAFNNRWCEGILDFLMKWNREVRSRHSTNTSKKTHYLRNCLSISWIDMFRSTVLKYKISKSMESFKMFLLSSLTINYVWCCQTPKSANSVIWLFPLLASFQKALVLKVLQQSVALRASGWCWLKVSSQRYQWDANGHNQVIIISSYIAATKFRKWEKKIRSIHKSLGFYISIHWLS